MRPHILKSLHIILITAFVVSSLPLSGTAQLSSTFVALPIPGTMVNLSPAFTPAIVRGMTIDVKNPFAFTFLIDRGDSPIAQEKKETYNKIIKYFLAAMTIAEDKQWVNLSPYEKSRIIDDDFGETEMGRDVLVQDFMLKQITSSLLHPEGAIGKEFWKRVYAQAAQKFGSVNIPVNTFNKVWITPDKASVFEKDSTVLIVESKLKVQLEEDYLATNKNRVMQDSKTIAQQVMLDIVIPALTKEVNEGKNFANLRQIFHGMILATWYKQALKKSILTQLYANKNKVKGVNLVNPNQAQQEVYQQYLKAFRKGVYNFIKNDQDSITGQMIPRKYFSGGWNTADLVVVSARSEAAGRIFNRAMRARLDAVLTNIVSPIDAASISPEQFIDENRSNISEFFKTMSGQNQIVASPRISETQRQEFLNKVLVSRLKRIIELHPPLIVEDIDEWISRLAESFIFEFNRQNDDWLIYDIKYANGDSVIIKQPVDEEKTRIAIAAFDAEEKASEEALSILNTEPVKVRLRDYEVSVESFDIVPEQALERFHDSLVPQVVSLLYGELPEGKRLVKYEILKEKAKELLREFLVKIIGTKKINEGKFVYTFKVVDAAMAGGFIDAVIIGHYIRRFEEMARRANTFEFAYRDFKKGMNPYTLIKLLQKAGVEVPKGRGYIRRLNEVVKDPNLHKFLKTEASVMSNFIEHLSNEGKLDIRIISYVNRILLLENFPSNVPSIESIFEDGLEVVKKLQEKSALTDVMLQRFRVLLFEVKSLVAGLPISSAPLSILWEIVGTSSKDLYGLKGSEGKSYEISMIKAGETVAHTGEIRSINLEARNDTTISLQVVFKAPTRIARARMMEFVLERDPSGWNLKNIENLAITRIDGPGEDFSRRVLLGVSVSLPFASNAKRLDFRGENGMGGNFLPRNDVSKGPDSMKMASLIPFVESMRRDTRLDKAMSPVGGIDFNPTSFKLKRDGSGVPLPLSNQEPAMMNIQGLEPHILEIKSAADLPIFGQLIYK